MVLLMKKGSWQFYGHLPRIDRDKDNLWVLFRLGKTEAKWLRRLRIGPVKTGLK